jgi:3-oxoacyl-[acyl-carrier-protein] synthase II
MNSTKHRRVVITGLGVITPIGLTVDDFWQSMMEGRSGVAPITYFDAKDFDTKIAAEVKGFDPQNYMDRKSANRMDAFTQFGVAASDMALRDAGIGHNDLDATRVGVVFGSGIGGMWTYHRQTEVFFETGGPQRLSPFFVPMMIADIAAGTIAIRNGFKGPNYATTSACATSAHAIADAYMLIQRGSADVIVTGGTESVICPMGIGGFNAMRALSTRNDDPERASRPFDLNRDGFVVGEGAGALILEEYEHAVKRGARIHAEILGIGLTADAFHITAPAPGGEGAVRSMRLAIEEAGIPLQDIDYINAHGTSTTYNDKAETSAIKTLFGDHAYKLCISSTKSMIGHLLGAAGAVESIASILAIQKQMVPPTINYETPDPECDLYYVPNKPVERTVRYAISNAFGFGGHNSSILFGKVNAMQG